MPPRLRGLLLGLLPCGFFGALTLALFAPFWTQEARIVYDIWDGGYPFKFFIGETWRSLRLPLWMPYQFLGYPIVADPSGTPFYPVTILLALLTGYGLTGVTLDLVVHYPIAGLGAYLWIRGLGLSRPAALAAGATYAYSGFMLFHAEHYGIIYACAWAPFLCHFARRAGAEPGYRVRLAAAIVLALLLLSGYPGLIVIAAYTLPFLLLGAAGPGTLREPRTYARAALRTAQIGLLAALLAAIQLLPVMAGKRHMDRGTGLTLARVMEGTFYPEHLLTFLFPSLSPELTRLAREPIFPNRVADLSLSNDYLGLLPLALLPLALLRGRRPLALLAALLVPLACALGPDVWARALFYRLPLGDLFRFPSLFLVPFNLAVAYAFAWAIDALAGGTEELLTKVGGGVRRLALLLALVGAAATLALLALPPERLGKRAVVRALTTDPIVGALLLGTLAILLAARARGAVSSRALKASILLLTVADLGSFWQRSFFVVSAAPATPADYAWRRAIEAAARASRSAAADVKLVDNYDIAKFFPNDGVFRNEVQSFGYNSYVLLQWKELMEKGDRRLLQGGVAYLVGDPRVPPDAVRTPDGFDRSDLGPGEGVAITAFTPPRFAFNAQVSAERLLVVAQLAHPGWSARLDGRAVAVEAVNGGLVGVRIPPGSHAVELTFLPPGFRVGAATTLATLLLLAVVALPPVRTRLRRLRAGWERP